MAEMNQTAYKISYSDFLSILNICSEANDSHIINIVEPIFMKAYKDSDLNSNPRNYMMSLSDEDYANLRKAIYSLPFRYGARAGSIFYRSMQQNNLQSMVNNNNQNIR